MGDRERWKPSDKELNTVEYLASLGHTQEQLAIAIGISESTFELALKKINALRQAVSRGRAKAHKEMTMRAYEMALSDPGMMKFWLSCKMGWSKTQKVELTGAGGGPLETSEETPEEKKKRLDAKLARLKSILAK